MTTEHEDSRLKEEDKRRENALNYSLNDENCHYMLEKEWESGFMVPLLYCLYAKIFYPTISRDRNCLLLWM